MDAAYTAFEKHQNVYEELEAALAGAERERKTLLSKNYKKVKWAIDQLKNKVRILKEAVAEPLASINASYLHLTSSVGPIAFRKLTNCSDMSCTVSGKLLRITAPSSYV